MVKSLVRYTQVDPVLGPWAKRHGLHIYTRAHDEEVRVIAIVDDAGDVYHICVTPQVGEVAVEATLISRAHGPVSSRERGHFAFSESASPDHLRETLDDAMERVQQWIADSGHTRTAVTPTI